ncbi:DarT ssDNA thymidine ADP-ribosyltransferase family protein [Novosphingobium panipatense]|uniref:DarT ssDNA thymidine ADP-ribosyltransferase family protein n=1 Tax=Novosphingobium panipatense TaxID=428991 RepID=UPI00361186FB
MKEARRTPIRSIAVDRDVRFLLHFTQAADLTGIVKHGLWPRRDLAAADHLAYASDYGRLDGNEDAVSVSISRVNGPMFAAKRRKSGHVDWIVLVLSATILWTHDYRFCWRNAARNEVKNHRGYCGGPWAFAQMFAGGEEERRDLAPHFSTDPEAEVQVLQPIEADHIHGAIVGQPGLAEPVRAIRNGLSGRLRQVEFQDFGLV